MVSRGGVFVGLLIGGGVVGAGVASAVHQLTDKPSLLIVISFSFHLHLTV